MKLAGGGGTDDLIATACALVYEDEFGHMAKGIVGLDDEGLAAADWEALMELSVELQKIRIRMRNAQFSHPLSDGRIGEIYDEKIAPIAFDFEKATEGGA